MSRKRRRNEILNINFIEKLVVFLAFLSIAERILVMIMFEG